MKQLLAAILVLWAAGASAQLLHGVTDSLSGGGTPTPPPTCDGSINLSSGCAQPMLGVM